MTTFNSEPGGSVKAHLAVWKRTLDRKRVEANKAIEIRGLIDTTARRVWVNV